VQVLEHELGIGCQLGQLLIRRRGVEEAEVELAGQDEWLARLGELGLGLAARAARCETACRSTSRSGAPCRW
jgi:hypothetical protein